MHTSDDKLRLEMETGVQRQDAKAIDAKRERLILIVHPDDGGRNRLADWLEDAGYGVIECPGPRRMDSTCLGVRGQSCGLVEIADLAILDGAVFRQADTNREAATCLLRYYLASDKPVLVLADGAGADFSFEDDRVAVAPRANRQSVLAAVSELLDLDRLAA